MPFRASLGYFISIPRTPILSPAQAPGIGVPFAFRYLFYTRHLSNYAYRQYRAVPALKIRGEMC